MRKEATLLEGPSSKGVVLDQNMADDAITKGAYVDLSNLGTWERFKEVVASALDRIQATDGDLQKRAIGSRLVPDVGRSIFPFKNAMIRLVTLARETHASGHKVIFVGNGGSAAIASHMAIDWTKNGGIRSIALNDPATLTCLGNDFGYENVFAKQLEFYATPSDLVIIISSSGRSPNILATGKWACDNGLRVVTLSGMEHSNELRRMGELNFYVPANDYGPVELAHICLLHSVVSVRW